MLATWMSIEVPGSAGRADPIFAGGEQAVENIVLIRATRNPRIGTPIFWSITRRARSRNFRGHDELDIPRLDGGPSRNHAWR